MSFLDKIREKSDHQKKIFSFVSALVLTLVIIVVWLSFSQKSGDNFAVDRQENKLSSVSPIQMIKDEFSEAYSSFNKQIEETGPVEIVTENLEVSSSTATSTDLSTTTEEIN